MKKWFALAVFVWVGTAAVRADLIAIPVAPIEYPIELDDKGEVYQKPGGREASSRHAKDMKWGGWQHYLDQIELWLGLHKAEAIPGE